MTGVQARETRKLLGWTTERLARDVVFTDGEEPGAKLLRRQP